MKKLVLLSTTLAGLAALFRDPRRRAAALDRLPGRLRALAPTQGGRPTADPARLAGNPDDATLAHKVETELFRSDDVPKGQIDVNVEFGKVVLRGEVESREMIDELVARTRAIDGVSAVESLLHTPDEAAPMHQ
jgi:hypothetical protein